eukprot:gene13363-9192_t
MGGDGQALTNKRSLLNKAKLWTSTEDVKGTCSEAQIRSDRWKHCAISLEPLEAPVVFDLGGVIYSKSSVIEYLLSRKEPSPAKTDAFPLTKVSDVREVVNELTSEGIRCPITGYATNSGVHFFVGFWGCGHVVASSAVHTQESEQNDDSGDCPVCGSSSVLVRLVVPQEDEKKQRTRLRTMIRSLRKRSREAK